MQHLAIIPDGNRRWAAKNKLKSFLGHQKGMDAVQTTIKTCLKNGIRYLSFYTFSFENFRRSEAEKTYLFTMLKSQFEKHVPTFIKQGIRVKFIGDYDYFPKSILSSVRNIEQKTEDCDALQLNLLFCYGGQQEIVYAAKKIAQRVQQKELEVDQISVDEIKNSLWTKGIPEPDLLIRTSCVIRLSNFLLFQMAYTEFMFLDCLWPEITEEKIQTCLSQFSDIKRNVGK